MASIAVSPGGYGQSTALAEVYEFYRVTRLRYRLNPVSTITASIGAAYIAGVVDNAPTAMAEVAQSQHCAIITPNHSLPTAWKSVPPSALRSYAAWCKTVVGSPDPDTEIQGRIYLAGTTTDPYEIEVELTFEFRTPVATLVTPAERGAIECAKERARLLKLMGLTPAPCSTPTSGK